MREAIVIFLWMACTSQTLLDAEKEERWSYLDEYPNPTVIAEGLNQPKGMAQAVDGGWIIAEYGSGCLLHIDEETEREVVLEDLDGPHSIWSDDKGLIIATDSALWVEVGEDYIQAVSTQTPPTDPLRFEDTLFWFEDGNLWRQENSHSSEVVDDDVPEPAGITELNGLLYYAERQSKELRKFDPMTGNVDTHHLFDDPPYDLTTYENSLIATTRSERWPYGGWILQIQDDDVIQWSESPPEPDQIKSHSNLVAWVSKQSITAMESVDETYQKLAGPTAVGDFVFDNERIVWTDKQSGKLFTRKY